MRMPKPGLPSMVPVHCKIIPPAITTVRLGVTLDGASLEQNVPNPFNNTTTISYVLPQAFTAAQIIITDKNGKTMKRISISGRGKGSVTLNASILVAGAYHYTLLVDGKVADSKQMVLAK